MASIESFVIIPGLRCNLECAHCYNASGPKQNVALSGTELEQLIKDINFYRPKSIILSGGEPTLYIDELAAILKRITYIHETVLTTNGFYATSLERVENKFSLFQRIDSLQLSFDRFHKSKSNSKIPFILNEYCKRHQINFCIIVSISDATELVYVKELEDKYQCSVIFQMVDASGRAKDTNSGFSYKTFDESVLQKKCPNARVISSLPGKGFSPCCANLVHNQSSKKYYESSVAALLEKNYYHEITNMTFKERMEKDGKGWNFVGTSCLKFVVSVQFM